MRKNLNLLTLAIAIAFVGLTGTMATGTGLCGDSNADGAVDISDAVYLIAYIFAGGPAPDCTSVTDIDGNVYRTVTIGTQVWMAENLKVTHYRTGDPIPNVTDGATWDGLTTGAYCEWNNDINTVAIYGRYYNWPAVADSRNIAPAGWHVPTATEWQTLVDYLGGDAVAGGKIKETGTAHWQSPNTGATNESGFTGLGSGWRQDINNGNYYGMGEYGVYWTSTAAGGGGAWVRGTKWSDTVAGNSSYTRGTGISVRCVKD